MADVTEILAADQPVPSRRRPGNPNWKPGVSGNPKGRPVGGQAFAEMIREVAGVPDTMQALVHVMLDVAMGRSVCIDPEWQRACAAARRAGQPMPPEPPQGERIQPTMAEIQRAQDMLMSWGFRKPPQQLEVASTAGEVVGFDYESLSEAELDQLEALHRKALRPLPEPQGAR